VGGDFQPKDVSFFLSSRAKHRTQHAAATPAITGKKVLTAHLVLFFCFSKSAGEDPNKQPSASTRPHSGIGLSQSIHAGLFVRPRSLPGEYCSIVRSRGRRIGLHKGEEKRFS
jgi:hypothetical protein